MTPASLRTRLVSEIKKRFRYDFKESNLTPYPLPLLRSICLKVGIQLDSKSYDFTESAVFTPQDILNLYPIIKHSEPRAGFAEQVSDHGLDCLSRKEEAKGLEMLRESLSILEQVHGPIHPDTARSLAQYALLKANQGKLEEARYYQKKAVLGYERSVGVDDPATLQQYVSLFLYWLMGIVEFGAV